MNDFLQILSNNEIVSSILITFFGVIASLVTAVVTYKSKQKIDIVTREKDDKEISKAIQNINIVYNNIDDQSDNKCVDKNVLNMMTDNVSELREYYVISKQQARKSFSAALFICFFGIFIYLLGIITYLIFDKNISIISIIGGTVVEVIAGLFFWLYREATKQLGIYHQRLGSTEKYLTVIQIIKEMAEDKQVEAYNNLIASILSDNKEIISHEK